MEGWSRDESPYHEGEQAMQARAGVRERAELMGQRMIRDFMPGQHRELFAELPFVLVGSMDARGQPWASMLWGRPGFVQSPDPRLLTLDALPIAGDPLADALTEGAPLGLLGIQLETRRRNRVNGRVAARHAHGFSLHVDQSFGNCPKYITARTPTFDEAHEPQPAMEVEGARLSPAAVACIEASDTCFIASASGPRASDDPREGVDVSHRGGKPGFVRVHDEDGPTVLTMPEFAGNNAFNTLGNLARYPRAGLLFPDFASGRVLSLTGSTEIVWEGHEVSRFRGALRLVRFRVARGLLLEDALPFTWSEAEPAAQLAQTGAWDREP